MKGCPDCSVPGHDLIWGNGKNVQTATDRVMKVVWRLLLTLWEVQTRLGRTPL